MSTAITTPNPFLDRTGIQSIIERQKANRAAREAATNVLAIGPPPPAPIYNAEPAPLPAMDPVLQFPSTTEKVDEAISFNDCSAKLDSIRTGREMGQNGKAIRVEEHLIDRAIVRTMKEFLQSRGQMFRAPYSYFLDEVDHALCRIDSPSTWKRLR